MAEEIYHLPTLPSLYLLDANQTVMSREISDIMDKISMAAQ